MDYSSLPVSDTLSIRVGGRGGFFWFVEEILIFLLHFRGNKFLCFYKIALIKF